MNRPTPSVLPWIAALCFAILACGGTRPSLYYAIPAPSRREASAETLPVGVVIERMSAPAIYRDSRIVYGYGPTRMGTYEYHRWIDPPPDMLQSAWLRLLRSSGKFSAVELPSSRAGGEYILRGRLYEFRESDPDGDGPSPIVAKVSFDLDLVHVESGKPVPLCSHDDEEPVHGDDVAALVEAMARSTSRGLDRCYAALLERLSR